MLPSQKHLFDIPENIVFYNCSYYSPQLKSSTKKLQEASSFKQHPWKMLPEYFFNQANEVRSLLAQLFGGNEKHYAITPSASYGINTAARILETHITANQTIVLIEDEFPALVYAMQRLSKETGATIITLPKPENNDWTTAICQAIDSDTGIVAISSCHWKNGASIDLSAVKKTCTSHNTKLLIDGTQTLGVVPFDVDEIKPDFLVAAAYKWLLCPYGFGMLYVDEKWHEERPLEETWMARSNAEDFNNLMHYSDSYMPGAIRFEVSEKSTPTVLPGVIEALKQIREWGIANIEQTLEQKTTFLAKKLVDLGFEVLLKTLRTPHILGATLPANTQDNLLTKLKEKNIYVSQRGSSIRFAPYLYNDETDCNTLLKVLKELCG